jgi:hypothetical protein
MSSTFDWLGGHIGHIALATFIYNSDQDIQAQGIAVDLNNIDERIETTIRQIIQAKTLNTTNHIGHANTMFGIESSTYLSFWGAEGRGCSRRGVLHDAISMDTEFLEENLPDVKCARISEESYLAINAQMQPLIDAPGDWSPLRNCATLARESLELARTPGENHPIMRAPTLCEQTRFIDTPNTIFDRFPDAIVLQFSQHGVNAVVPHWQ